MKPFRQGALDCTCGIYSIVNATRLAARQLRILPLPSWVELYCHLVTHAEKRPKGLAAVIELGLSGPEIEGLLRAADRWLRKNEEISLNWSRPIRRGQAWSQQELSGLLRAHTRQGGSAVLGISNGMRHWTTLREVSEKSLLLADSIGLKRLGIESALRQEQSRSSAWRVTPVCTFLISCDALDWGSH